MVAYTYMNKTGPTTVALYNVNKRWNDPEGNSFYYVDVYLPIKEATRYELWRVDKYNSLWEVQWSNNDYPEKIDPKDLHSSYHIHYRY